MSFKPAALSDPAYGYDMVVAVTQVSVNAALQEWLDRCPGEPFTQAFVFDPATQASGAGFQAVDWAQLVRTLEFDPFDVPNGTPLSDPRVRRLVDHKFLFAFQAVVGLPSLPGSPPVPVLEFRKEGTTATFNLQCRSFRLLSLEQSLYEPPHLLNLSQDEGGVPWVFSFDVDLNLRHDDINNHLHRLPPTAREAVTRLGADMFSVQQLYLDLNALRAPKPPVIRGLDPGSPAYVALTRLFINRYLGQLAEPGSILLGHCVVSHSAAAATASLAPTDMDFIISAYKDSKQAATEDYPAYTLNYLVMTQGKPLPCARPFAWNWVDKTSLGQYAGAMAINRTAFVQFLHDRMSPALRAIAIQPQATFTVSGVKAHIAFSYQADPSPVAYSVVQNGGAHVLSFTTVKSSGGSDWNLAVWGNFSVEYTGQSDIHLEGNEIRVVTSARMRGHLNIESGVTEGSFGHMVSTTCYTLGVDAHGRITVRKSKAEVKDLSENVKTSGWSEFASFGTVDSTVDTIRTALKSWVSNLLLVEAAEIEHMLNGSSAWVFPGNGTFSFVDAGFSDRQDLVANLLYLSPQ